MYSKVLIVFAVAALATGNDIHEGTNNTQGLKPFFERHYEAQWGLTQITKDLFVNTSGVITGINVTDLREAKDGQASIVSCGIGCNNVTISLKSPAAFRGYHFVVEIYSDEEVERGSRGVEPSTPEVTVRPAEEFKSTDKPVTATGKPSTELPDKVGITFPAGSPDVTLTTTTGKPDVTLGPVQVSTGKPEVTGHPTGVPKEVEVPEEVEDMPMKKIGFHPPRIQY